MGRVPTFPSGTSLRAAMVSSTASIRISSRCNEVRQKPQNLVTTYVRGARPNLGGDTKGAGADWWPKRSVRRRRILTELCLTEDLSTNKEV